MMPVERLPAGVVADGLGSRLRERGSSTTSPLTALAIRQEATTGAFSPDASIRGSMLWFGSSAGVALSSMYPEAKTPAAGLRDGWHVTVATSSLLRHAGGDRLSSRSLAQGRARRRFPPRASPAMSRPAVARCARRLADVLERLREHFEVDTTRATPIITKAN